MFLFDGLDVVAPGFREVSLEGGFATLEFADLRLDLGFCVECRLDSECEDDEVCRSSECVELDDDDDDDDDD